MPPNDQIGNSMNPVYQTTLLDLLVGIDELATGDQESLVTARELLRAGQVQLVTRPSELTQAHMLPRKDLRELMDKLAS